MSRCVIFAAADIADYSDIKRRLRPGDFIICADAGLKHAEALGVRPDLIVGDMDSFTREVPENVECITTSAEKDETDTLLAVQQALGRGFLDIFIFGGLGGRLDHTLANISVLLYAAERGGNAVLADESCEVRMLKPGRYYFEGEKGKYFSLFAYLAPVKGLNIRGAKYELDRAEIDCSFPVGASNEFIGEKVEVSFTEGRLLAVFNY